MSSALSQIEQELARLEQELQQKREAAMGGLRKRLAEIEQAHRDLEAEAADIRRAMGEAPKSAKRGRRAGGPRIGSDHKRSVIARLIQEGHIKHGDQMTRELRAVLKDEGFKAPDFVNLEKLFPEGWQVIKNGERGLAAKAEFRRV